MSPGQLDVRICDNEGLCLGGYWYDLNLYGRARRLWVIKDGISTDELFG